ncbi:MAG: hypothetical protein QOJ89_3177 [bacterium]
MVVVALDQRLARPVFTVDDAPSAWADVIAAARAWGTWDPVERAAAAGLLGAGAQPPPDVTAIVEARATVVRRERRLLAADDVVVWLQMWGITTAQWFAHLRRQVLSEGASADPAGADRTALAQAAWIEGVTGGELERTTLRLAERRAAWASRAGTRPEPDHAALERAVAELCDDAATPARLAAVVERNRLGWTRLELREVVLADEGAAHELVYCLRDDGRDLAEVACEAGLTVHSRATTVDELAPALARLTAARPGEVTDPVAIDGAHRVIVVDARVEPTVGDRATAARARELIVRGALAGQVSRRVRWLDPAVRG